MPSLTGGQALVQQLRREGIDTVFGLPGVQMDWAFDALYEERDHLRVIHTRHEQGAAYMADGYARVTGRIGLCMVVPGPGLLNTTAALSTAFACNSPVLCVTGQVNSRNIQEGRGLLHEIDDQLGMIASVTKWQALARRPAEIPAIVQEAVRQLTTGRRRPVEIEVPPDVLAAREEVALLEPRRFEPAAADPDLIDRAARALAGAARPLIFAGGGVIGSDASAELQQLAEALEAPVVLSGNGKGALSDRHYLSLPARAAAELGPEADVALFVGTRFQAGVMQAASPPWLTDGRTLIHVDIDAEEIGRNFTPDIGIVAEARPALAALTAAVERRAGRPASRREELLALKQYLADDAATNHPQSDFGLAIRAELPDDGVLVHEPTQVGFWAGQAFPVYEPRTFISPGYQGTLGFGFATALGAQVGRPDRRVVSVSGDGGFFYNVQELSTMVQQKIPLTAIVFNDNSYGNVKRIQQTRFDGRLIAVDLHNPDMMKLADAYGLTGRRASSAAELRASLRDAFSRAEPCLIEVPVGPMPAARYTPRTPA